MTYLEFRVYLINLIVHWVDLEKKGEQTIMKGVLL